jgi:hypothetical protein
MGQSFSKDRFKKIYDREAIIDGNVKYLKTLLNDISNKDQLKELFELKNFEGRSPLHLVFLNFAFFLTPIL